MINNTQQRDLRNSKLDSLDLEDLKACLEGVGYFAEANIIPPIFEIEQREAGTVSKQAADPITHFVTKSSQSWRDFKMVRPENYMHTTGLILNDYEKIKKVLARPQRIFSYSTPITFSESASRSGQQISSWNSLQKQLLSASSKNRFTHLLEVDIQGCYHTLYTHAIEWAFKPIRNEKFGGKLDESIRGGNMKRTHGLPVGQYSSDILAEIVLSWVDKNIETALQRVSCTGYRFKDNYYFLCKDASDGEHILAAVATELRNAHFTINEAKTNISLFSDYYSSRWQSEFNLLKESLQLDERSPVFTNRKLKVFVEQSIILSSKYKNQKSILEKAITTITRSNFTGYIDYKWLFYAMSNMLPLRSLSYAKILAFMKKLVMENHTELDDVFSDFMQNEINRSVKRNDLFALFWLAYILHDITLSNLKDSAITALGKFSASNALANELLKYLKDDHSDPILWNNNQSKLIFKHREYMEASALYDYLGISFGES